MTETASRVKRLMAEHLFVALDKVTDTARIVDDLNADSLDGIELTMAVEEEFGIEIWDEEAEKIVTVADAIALVERTVKERGR